MREIATRSRMETFPINIPKKLKTELYYTEEDFQKMIRGFNPYDMDEKWFILYEDEWLYFYRSWTGFEIYRAKIHKEAEGYSIKEFLVERDQQKYKNQDDERDLEFFTKLIQRDLLGIF